MDERNVAPRALLAGIALWSALACTPASQDAPSPSKERGAAPSTPSEQDKPQDPKDPTQDSAKEAPKPSEAPKSGEAAKPGEVAKRHSFAPISVEALQKLQADQRRFASLLGEGQQASRAGRLDEAAKLLGEALALRPDSTAALGELGWVLFQQKRLGPAAAHTSRALLLEPEGRRKGALLYNLGRIAEDQGEPDKAADHYRRSLAVRPGNGEARKRLDALTANAKPRAKAPLDAMCEAATDDWNCTKGDAPEGSECTCKVERVIEPDKNSPFLRAALLSVWGHPDIGGVHDGTLHLAVETESGGWQHLSMIANSLSPGVAYIHNHGEVTAMRYEDAIPGGPQELVLDISQDEDDGDYGENVNEYSTLRATFVCWQDEAPRCAYLPRAYTYGLGPMVDDLPPPPEVWERSWSLSMRLNPDATVTYAVESGDEWLTAPQKELLGTHPLRDVGRFYEATVTELR